MSPDEFDAFFQKETDRLSKLVSTLGLKEVRQEYVTRLAAICARGVRPRADLTTRQDR
jgi:hypothetical protein